MLSTTVSGSSRSISLPLEILEKILEDIDKLDGRPTIVNCSLVSKTFLRLCRAHLFRHIKLCLEPEHPGGVASSSVQLIGLLASDDHLSSQIRSMRIIGTELPPETLSAHSTLLFGNLSKLIQKLNGLRHLVIQFSFFTNWSLIHPDFHDIINRLTDISTLQYLEFHYLAFTTQELLSLIRIPEVTLIGVSSIDPEETEAARILTRNSEIRSVLHNLKLVMKGPNVARFLASLVDSAAGSLKSIEWLSSPYHEMERTHLEFITLRNLSSLVSITVCIPMDESGIGDLVALFGSATGGTTCCKLENIQVVCDYRRLPDRRDIDEWEWRGMETALIDYCLNSSLKAVKISVKKIVHPKHNQPSTGVYERMLEELLALFSEKLHMLVASGIRVERGEVL